MWAREGGIPILTEGSILKRRVPPPWPKPVWDSTAEGTPVRWTGSRRTSNRVWRVCLAEYVTGMPSVKLCGDFDLGLGIRTHAPACRRRAALEEFSAKQLRLMMCLQPWGGGMKYGGQSRAAMISREKELKEFFLDVDVAQRDIAAATAAGATLPSDAQVRHALKARG